MLRQKNVAAANRFLAERGPGKSIPPSLFPSTLPWAVGASHWPNTSRIQKARHRGQPPGHTARWRRMEDISGRGGGENKWSRFGTTFTI